MHLEAQQFDQKFELRLRDMLACAPKPPERRDTRAVALVLTGT